MLVEQTTLRPTTVLTVAGLNGPAHGVRDPVVINARQLGTVDPASMRSLRRLRPRASRYLLSTLDAWVTQRARDLVVPEVRGVR